MRRLRAGPAAGRPLTPTAHARNNIRAAVNLLAWLRGRGTTLAAAGQTDIDQWLRTGPSAILARDFLSWAPTRPLPAAEIPVPARTTGPAISQDQRWALISRLLNDATLDPTDRVAGCLLLLYGQPLSRIAVDDHQPGHPPRGRHVPPASAAMTSPSPARSPPPSST